MFIGRIPAPIEQVAQLQSIKTMQPIVKLGSTTTHIALEISLAKN
jgi:hypothetical protein